MLDTINSDPSYTRDYGSNTPPENEKDKLLSAVRSFGRDEAKGQDAMPKLAIAVVNACQTGVIDNAKDADGKDMAFHIYAAKEKARFGKAEFGANTSSDKVQVSKLRQILNAGCSSKHDFGRTMDRLIKAHEKARGSGDESLKAMYAAMVDAAREQLKPGNDVDLTDAQIDEVMHKPERAAPDTLKRLNKIRKDLEKVITGGENVEPFQADEVLNAEALVKQAIDKLELKMKQIDALEKALETGIIDQEQYDARMALAA